MATVHILPLSIRLTEFTAGAKNQRNFATFTAKKRPISVFFAVNSPESTPEVPDKVEIELEFIGPRPGDDGEYPIERAKAVSGEKLLRNVMLDNKIELYAPYGKVMNCGGGGSCGTCIVEIIDRQDLLNERTNTELRYLKKACLLCHPLSLAVRCSWEEFLDANAPDTIFCLIIMPDLAAKH